MTLGIRALDIVHFCKQLADQMKENDLRKFQRFFLTILCVVCFLEKFVGILFGSWSNVTVQSMQKMQWCL